MNRDIKEVAGVLIVAAIMAAVLMVLMSLAGCTQQQKKTEFVQAVPGVPMMKLRKGEAFIAPEDGEFYTTAYLNAIKAAMKKRAEEASE